jgi:predicted Zn-dependent peptidase
VTFYFITVPSNKFELWAWMESDRLSDSVFREFYAERDVVHEERRLRTESTPTGVFQEQFEAMFWQSSPYQWPVIGWPSDLNSYTLEEARRYFDVYYRPNNLVGIVVGDFDPSEVRPVIDLYLGRLQRAAPGAEPPPVVTLEVKQLAEMRMNAECDCQPEVEVRYHTVPFNHADSFALEMLAQVLNGQTGRLYKAMVDGKKIAAGASASQNSRTYAGSFSFTGEVKGEAAPRQLEEAWYEELEKLKKELVPERELQKVRNRVAANAYRRLQSNFFIMVQLGTMESSGGWEYINTSTPRLLAVTPEDIRRVAGTYFEPTNRSVATFTRKAGAAVEDPELAEFSPQQKAMIRRMLASLEQAPVEELRRAVPEMESRMAQVPPDFAKVFRYLQKKAAARLAALETAAAAP